MATNFGELRETLVKAIDAVKSGSMDAKDATAIAKLAAQVTNSLQVEINAIRELRALGINSTPGTTSLGSVIEVDARPQPAPPPAVERPAAPALPVTAEKSPAKALPKVAVKDEPRADPDAELRHAAREAATVTRPKFVHGSRY